MLNGHSHLELTCTSFVCGSKFPHKLTCVFACAGEEAAGGALGGGATADDPASLAAALFKGCTFFLAREVPRESLMLVIRCEG